MQTERRTVHLSWRGVGTTPQFFSFFCVADDEAEVLGCIKEAVDDVPQGFLRVGEKGEVIVNSSSVMSSLWFSRVRGDAEG